MLRQLLVVLLVTVLVASAIPVLRPPPKVRTEAWLLQSLKKQVRSSVHSANATLMLEESFFTKLTSVMLPAINQLATSIAIPGETESHFSFDTFHLSSFSLAGISIAFQAPNKIVASLNGLSLSIPETHFSVFEEKCISIFHHKHCLKISCSGDFWGSVSNSNLAVTMAVSTSASGVLQVDSVTPTVQFGSVAVKYKFSNDFCKVAGDIVSVFVGGIDNLIKKLVEKDLPPKIASMVQKYADEALSKLPVSVLSQPTITDNSLAVTIDIIPKATRRPRFARPSITGAQVLHRERSLPDRDIAVEIADTSVNQLMVWLRNRGDLDKNITIPPNKYNTSALEKLIPAAYQLCPNCPFSIEINMVNAPTVTFLNQGVTLYVMNSIFGLNAVNPSGVIVPLIDMNLNTTSVLSNFSILGSNKSTIMFQLAIPSFAVSVYESQIGPINAKDLSGLMQFLLQDIVAPEFNKKFKGITLPTEDGFGIDDVVLTLTNDVLSLGIDVVLPPLEE